ncbi:hypothetical protein J6590_035268 [Homalodisca vitripennis]|nr:hypothetical protein J6590_035268 [Homalodisca vitripennis]
MLVTTERRRTKTRVTRCRGQTGSTPKIGKSSVEGLGSKYIDESPSQDEDIKDRYPNNGFALVARNLQIDAITERPLRQGRRTSTFKGQAIIVYPARPVKRVARPLMIDIDRLIHVIGIQDGNQSKQLYAAICGATYRLQADYCRRIV